MPKNAPANWEPSLIGYQVRNVLQIHTNKIEQAGEIIDEVPKEGGNVIQSLSFSLKDDQEAKGEVIAQTFRQAAFFADAAAKAAGIQLGKILEISITPPYANVRLLKTAKAFVESETPISPKEVEITASIALVYALYDEAAPD
jgi:uncharacterized protein